LTEWHIDPVYIDANWTDEMLQVMLDKLVARKKRINDAISGNQGDDIVSEETLLAQMGNKVQVTKQ
ncbi:MAG: hypothetical protein PHQ37_07960, partial [Methanocellales archaeon]|nr:hypothetical protein [Methanocellales archaeon]